MKKKVYLAGPFFNEQQINLRDRIEHMLDGLEFNVYSPGRESLITETSTSEEQQNTFKQNLKAIDDCDFVIAIGNDYDTGTMIEIGYAYKANKPVIYYNDSHDGKKRNLMIAGASFASFDSLVYLYNFLLYFNNKHEEVE